MPDKYPRRWLTLAGVLLTLLGCAGARPGLREPRDDWYCDRAPQRIPGLIEAGKLDRARRVIARANAMCPSREAETWAAQITVLVDLGRHEEALVLADRIDGSLRANEDARAAARAARLAPAPGAPDPDGLFRAGQVARRAGRAAEAQRLFDRALVDLERAARSDGTKDASTTVRLDVPNGFSGRLHAIAWDPTNANIAVAHGLFVSILDPTTLVERHRLVPERKCGCEPRTGAESITFSPDGAHLALATDFGVELYDVRSGVRVWVAQGTSNATVWYGAGGDAVWGHFYDRSTERHRIAKWDSRTGGLLASSAAKKAAPLEAARKDVTVVDGRGAAPAQVTVGTGKRARTFPLELESWAVATASSADGKRVAVGSQNGELVVVDVDRPSQPLRVGAHASNIRSLGFTEDGELLSGSGDGAARRWDGSTGRVTRVIPTGSGAVVGFAPDGSRVAGGCGDADRRDVCIWDGASGERLALLPYRQTEEHLVSEVGWAWSGDGSLLALAATDGLRLWDARRQVARSTLRTWLCHEKSGECDVTQGLAFDPSGTHLAEGESGRVWNVDSLDEDLVTDPGSWPVSSAAWAPDGKMLATSSRAVGGIRLYALADGTRTWELVSGLGEGRRASSAPVALAFSPDARWLAAVNEQGNVDLWNFRKGRVQARLDDGKEQATAVAFHPQGNLVAVGYRSGRGRWRDRDLAAGSIGLWSVPEGRFIATLRAVDGTTDSYVFTEGADGGIEFFGEAGRKFALCRSGSRTLPFEACAERFEETGFVTRRLASPQASSDP